MDWPLIAFRGLEPETGYEKYLRSKRIIIAFDVPYFQIRGLNENSGIKPGNEEYPEYNL